MTISSDLRSEIADLINAYALAIDDGELERWPGFFANDCLYKVIAKENFESGLPLGLLLCDSKGMLQDRMEAFSKLNVFGPRSWRHMLGAVQAMHSDDEIRARTSFVIFETLAGEDTHILCAGEYRDIIVCEDGTLKFRERLCVYDTTMIPNSIVRPI